MRSGRRFRGNGRIAASRAACSRSMPRAEVGSRVAESAVDAAQSALAGNSLEKMLCHQMAAVHRAAMKLVARSLDMHDEPIKVLF